eukprot:9248408-Ditylum_brightwellii.AAC.1
MTKLHMMDTTKTSTKSINKSLHGNTTWHGITPAEMTRHTGKAYAVWECKTIMHNALIAVTATNEESWPYYKGMDRGHTGYSNIYEAFKKAPKLFAKFKNKFEEELEK